IEAGDWLKIRQVVVELDGREGRLEEVNGLLARSGYEVDVEPHKAFQTTGFCRVFAWRGGAEEARTGMEPEPQCERRDWLKPEIKGSWRSPDQVLEEVRRAALAKLPDYMIPDVIVLLEEMPVMANGKIDRQAL